MFKSHIKLNLLKELKNEDLSGYSLMSRLGEIEGKKPSPGYIYPLLKELEEKGYLTFKKQDRKKIYTLTKSGKDILLQMQKNHEETLEKMTKILDPIIDKDEMEKFLDFKRNMHKHKTQMIKDMDIMEKFHNALFKIYEKNDSDSKKELRKIIIETTKKIENIKHKVK